METVESKWRATENKITAGTFHHPLWRITNKAWGCRGLSGGHSKHQTGLESGKLYESTISSCNSLGAMSPGMASIRCLSFSLCTAASSAYKSLLSYISTDKNHNSVIFLRSHDKQPNAGGVAKWRGGVTLSENSFDCTKKSLIWFLKLVRSCLELRSPSTNFVTCTRKFVRLMITISQAQDSFIQIIVPQHPSC